MAKYRKKPIVVEAVQWNGLEEPKEVVEFCPFTHFDDDFNLIARTIEGDMVAHVSDYIIKGIKGEFYPCRADIFEATYEKVK